MDVRVRDELGRSRPGRIPARSDDTRIESRSVPCPSGATWVEQDSNLRRQCHQIYSLAPLAAWVSTRGFDRFPTLSVCPSCRLEWRRNSSGPVRRDAGPHRGRAGGETRTHNPRFTKPMLCRLSYASKQAVKFSTIPTRCRIARPFPPSRTKRRPPARGRGARAARRLVGNERIIRSGPGSRQEVDTKPAGDGTRRRCVALTGRVRGRRLRLRWWTGHCPRAGC